jgi:regulator of sirC expression with transglutaminase-like and TPR domain
MPFHPMSAMNVIELFESDPEPPLDEVALAIARDADARLDLDAQRAGLDDLAAPLRARASMLHRPLDQAALLGTYVYDELGFAGDEETYDDPANSYLPRVIARRKGIPISLGVVLAALGRRAGMAVEGIGFPGHFLVRLGGPGGVYVDPFFRAKVMSPSALDALLQRVTGEATRVQDEHTAVVGARAVAVRMLANLKNSHERRGDHARALVVCDRLVDLTGAPELRRDRGMHALALGAMEAASSDLRAYLNGRPGAKDTETVTAALDDIRKKRASVRPMMS